MDRTKPRSDVSRVMELYPRIFFACHTRHVRDEAADRTLTSHQASILDHLDEHHALALGELARHMGVTPGTMSVHVDRLARMGYVSKSRSPADGRQVDLRLTEAGVRVRDDKSVLDPTRVARMLGHLASDQRAEAVRGLALLARAAAQEMVRRAPARAAS